MRLEAKKLFKAFEGIEIYLVGGYVRDYLLDLESDDLDFATLLSPDDIIEVLERNHLKHWEIGKAFGTITTQIDKLKIEITTYRVDEKYTKNNRHPRVKFGKKLKDDLARRDFTINALAMDRKENILDFFHGRAALENRILQTPLDPNKTFSDDPLRMIRAIRFVSKLGMQIEGQTLFGMLSNAHRVSFLSTERIKTEMDKLLTGKYITEALDLLVETRIINYYLPEITSLVNITQPKEYHHKDVWEHTKSVVKNTPQDKILRWAALLHDIAKPYTRDIVKGNIHFYQHEDLGAKLVEYILKRLKFSNVEIKEITTLIANHMRPNLYTKEWSDKAVRRLKNDLGDLMPKLMQLSKADITSHRPDRVDEALNRLNELKQRLAQPEFEEKLKSPVSGNWIMKILSLRPSSLIGELKNELIRAIEDGELPKEDGSYEAHLRQYLKTREALEEE